MPRIVEISTSAERAESLVRALREIDGVIGIALQRDGSIAPPGDVVSVRTTNEGCRSVLRHLDAVELADEDTIVTSEPRSVISSRHRDALDAEGNETIWEEMAFMLRRNTNPEQNYLALMTLAGAIAAVGLWTATLYTVVAAMIVAPAFEALTRIPFGLIGGPRRVALRGVHSTAAGYLLMAAGAAVAFVLLRIVDPAGTPDLAAMPLVQHWSTLQASGVLLALFAGAAGAVVVAGQRPVLSTGVQIALALIPSMSIVGMAIVAGDLPLAGRGLGRWAAEVALILIANAGVLGTKQLLVQRRHARG